MLDQDVSVLLSDVEHGELADGLLSRLLRNGLGTNGIVLLGTKLHS